MKGILTDIQNSFKVKFERILNGEDITECLGYGLDLDTYEKVSRTPEDAMRIASSIFGEHSDIARKVSEYFSK